jgi:hypothetical protein
MDKKSLTLAAAICGAVTAIGTLLPWATAKTFMMEVSAAGTESTKGVFVLILGLLGGAAALLVHLGKVGQIVKLDEKQHVLIGLGCFALAIILILTTFVDGGYKTQTVMGQEFGASRGIGLWLCLLASLAGGAALFMVLKPSLKPTTPAP